MWVRREGHCRHRDQSGRAHRMFTDQEGLLACPEHEGSTGPDLAFPNCKVLLKREKTYKIISNPK